MDAGGYDGAAAACAGDGMAPVVTALPPAAAAAAGDAPLPLFAGAGAQMAAPLPSAEDLALLEHAAAMDEHEGGAATAGGKMHRPRQARLKRVQAAARIVGSNLSGEQQLHSAVNDGDYDTVVALLNRGVNVNAADDRRRTALHFACTKGNVDIVRLLLSRGANQKLTDCRGNTPLHLAACTSNVGIISAMLKAGGDVSAKDDGGFTPLDYAKSHIDVLQTRGSLSGHRQSLRAVVDILLQYLNKIGDKDTALNVRELAKQIDEMDSKSGLDTLQALLTSLSLGSGAAAAAAAAGVVASGGAAAASAATSAAATPPSGMSER